MTDITQYFYVEYKNIPKEKKIFPFHLYLFNRLNSTYAPFLMANNPLSDVKRQFLEYVIDKGAIIAIDFKQKKTFMKATDLKESDLIGLQSTESNHLVKSQQHNRLLYETHLKEKGNFNFIDSFDEAVNTNNYLEFINWARLEISSFPVTISHTISLAAYLAEKRLTEDNPTNRVVALTFQLAKLAGIMDESSLADLVCAAFLHHIGLTQLDFEILRESRVKLSNLDKRDYEGHTVLSMHLIKKSGIELSARAERIVLEHHERIYGNGYPNKKTEEEIDTFALILGAASFVIDYTGGKITGNIEPFRSVIKNLESKRTDAGLEFGFGDTITDILLGSLKDNSFKQAA